MKPEFRIRRGRRSVNVFNLGGGKSSGGSSGCGSIFGGFLLLAVVMSVFDCGGGDGPRVSAYIGETLDPLRFRSAAPVKHGGFSVVPLAAAWRDDVESNVQPRGRFLVVEVRATNVGNGIKSPPWDFRLVDQEGAFHDPAKFGSWGSRDAINPGLDAVAVRVFDVSPERDYWLQYRMDWTWSDAIPITTASPRFERSAPPLATPVDPAQNSAPAPVALGEEAVSSTPWLVEVDGELVVPPGATVGPVVADPAPLPQAELDLIPLAGSNLALPSLEIAFSDMALVVLRAGWATDGSRGPEYARQQFLAVEARWTNRTAAPGVPPPLLVMGDGVGVGMVDVDSAGFWRTGEALEAGETRTAFLRFNITQRRGERLVVTRADLAGARRIALN